MCIIVHFWRFAALIAQTKRIGETAYPCAPSNIPNKSLRIAAAFVRKEVNPQGQANRQGRSSGNSIARCASRKMAPPGTGVLSRLAGIPVVISVYTPPGKRNLVIEASAQPLIALDSMLAKIRSFEGGRESEASILLKTRKTTAWRIPC